MLIIVKLLASLLGGENNPAYFNDSINHSSAGGWLTSLDYGV